jgi:adenylate cyclase
MPSAPDVAQVQAWLQQAPHVGDGGVSFLRELVALMCRHGMALWRVSLSLPTKHPEVLWRNVQWREGEGVIVLEREHHELATPFFSRSPVALLIRGSPPVRARLAETDGGFPICRDLKQQGGTDYYAQGLKFSSGATSYVSWATREAGGFSAEAIAALDALMPSLAQRVEIESAHHATRALLEVYLGRNAARRVFDGQFLRGGGELIRAAIWFCDLRDFTAISDRMAPHEVVGLLDAYFERVVDVVTLQGGEVLKFIGDAVLAIFPLGPDAGETCASALRAAEEALHAVRRLNEEHVGSPPLAIGVALHLGDVMYGNIGSRGRLDFTVISSSVNETCRLEALCKPLGTPLVLSEEFVAAVPGAGFVDLGLHDLKGVARRARVFTVNMRL